MREALVCSGVGHQRLAAEVLVGGGSNDNLDRISWMKKLRGGLGVYIGQKEAGTDFDSR